VPSEEVTATCTVTGVGGLRGYRILWPGHQHPSNLEGRVEELGVDDGGAGVTAISNVRPLGFGVAEGGSEPQLRATETSGSTTGAS
jgi:hypothetical protein